MLAANWPAKVISIAAAVLLFLFHRVGTLEERFFSVPLNVIENEEFIPAEPYPDKVRVTLRGSEEGIYHILEEDVVARIDLTEYNSEGTYEVPVEVRKRGSALNVDPLEIQVEPMKITIELEEKITKTLEVTPSFDGFPAHGYEMEQYFLTPTFVKVEGPRSYVKDLDTVNTEEIDLSGKKENFTVRANIKHPNDLVRFPGGDVVEFHAIIQEAIILKTFEPVDIIRMDLDPDLIVTSGQKTGSVKVQGSQLIIEKISLDEIRLVVDCSTIQEEGVYTLPTKPDVPMGLLVLNYDPVEVTFTVEEYAPEPEEEEQ